MYEAKHGKMITRGVYTYNDFGIGVNERRDESKYDSIPAGRNSSVGSDVGRRFVDRRDVHRFLIIDAAAVLLRRDTFY